MVRRSNPHAVIGGVGAQVGPVANEIAGGARVEEAGVPGGCKAGQDIAGGETIPNLNDGRARQVVIPGRPCARGGNTGKSGEWSRWSGSS